MRLGEALELSSTGALRRMAGVHGLVYDDGTTRAELIERLGERLLDSAYVKEVLGALGEHERAALLEAHASGGEVRGLLIDRDFPGAGDALVERGLLFRVFASTGPRRGEVFAVPEEVLALLPRPPSMSPPPAVEPGPSPAHRRASDPVFSLFALASALRRAGAALEPEVREWSEEPGGWDWDARWTFLRHLGQAAGLLVHQADGALAPGPSLARLLDDPPALTDRLWRTYVRDGSWSELRRAGLDRGEELADTLPLRQALIDAVQQLHEGAWIGLAALSDWLRRARPAIVREQLNARGLVLLDSVEWSDLEQPLIRYVLLGPLYWLGVVAASADGLLVARRPPASVATRVSAEACHWESARDGAAEHQQGDVQSGGHQGHDPCAELVAPPRAELGTLLQAERYLVLLRRDRPSRYHLVQSHVAAALGSGGSLAECRRLLLKLTQTSLPTEVDQRLAAWERRFGAVHVRPAVLVEARSETELDAALADERVRPFVRARLGPRAAEVAAADALELAAALRASGHLPQIDAALRLAAEPRRAYAGLVDEQVLEFLLVSLLAFQQARPERLAELEGAPSLLERLERQFPAERLAQLRRAAERLAGELAAGLAAPRPTGASGRRGSGRGRQPKL
jgi:hypothetical protein